MPRPIPALGRRNRPGGGARAGYPRSMEAVILCGVQASGKTRFFRDRFLDTHVRISRDLLRTPHRERRFLELCLETGQRFVVDKTNATPAHRRPYVDAARDAGFSVVAYVLEVAPAEAIARNAGRRSPWRVPVRAILGTAKALEPPRREEGFSAVWRVRADGAGDWVVEPGAEVPPQLPETLF